MMGSEPRPGMSRLLAERPVHDLRGVGPRQSERLANLGISTLQDLVFHLPSRYQDRTRLYPIGSLLPGQHVVIEGTVELSETTKGKRVSLIVRVSDGSGSIDLRFFHFNKAQIEAMRRGTRLRCYGETRPGRWQLEIAHPEYRIISESGVVPVEEHLTPVYPATEGLQQTSLRRLVMQALAQISGSSLPELLPAEELRALALPGLHEALHILHQPTPEISISELESGIHPAQQRLALEELAAHQLSLLKLRADVVRHAAPRLSDHAHYAQRLLASLPFKPTAAQTRVANEIYSDLNKPHPMLRLVQGDVGSGKTLVAALAACAALGSDKQVAIMAPTEILAEQHALNFRRWFEPLGVEVAWLAGKSKGKARAASLEAIASGTARLVVGTHALFQQGVTFWDLGLAIIDEQHRFGVHQRLSLTEKGRSEDGVPHQLIMTATPIPRTLAMTAYADLDCSVIDELPPGRTPITTVAVPDSRRDEVMARVEKACHEGRQAYWVCTLIEESEVLEAQAAEATAAELAQMLPNVRIGLVHGRLKPAQKQAQMQAFKAHELDLLVATTVIEVGVDVPNASLMIIENPERLGLAQLHQLRGRVGRGAVASHCVLLYKGPLSQMGRARLGVLRDSNDGFVIAEKDLQLRGPGEVLGTRQTGIVTYKIADLTRDEYLIEPAHRLAEKILAKEPRNAEALIVRWLSGRERYARA